MTWQSRDSLSAYCVSSTKGRVGKTPCSLESSGDATQLTQEGKLNNIILNGYGAMKKSNMIMGMAGREWLR